MPADTDVVLRRFLARVKEEKADLALQALQRPQDKTAFGYGEASGLIKGLECAERLFNEVIGEEEDRT